VLASERRALACRGNYVLRDETLDRVAAEHGATSRGEEEVGAGGLYFREPGAHQCHRRPRERCAALLTALAVTADVGGWAKDQILDTQPGQLRDAEPGLKGDGQQHVVTAAEPGRAIRCRQ
jgi:hypothetical protein